MHLRSKIVVIMGVVIAGYAVLDHLVQRVVLRPSFEALEAAQALQDLDRAVRAIHGEIVLVDQACRTSAGSRATIRAVAQGDLAGLDGSLLDEQARNLGHDLVLLASASGEVLHRSQVRAHTGQPFSLEEVPDVPYLDPGHSWLVQENMPRGRESLRGYSTGIAMTEHGPMIVSSRPVLVGGDPPHVAGSVVLAKFLDERLLATVGRQARIRLNLWALDDPTLPPADRALLGEVTTSANGVLRMPSEQVIQAYATLNDMRKGPALLLRVDLAREISAQSDLAIHYGFVSTLASGMLLLTVLLALLQKVVLNPIAQLTDHAVRIGKSDDTSVRLGLNRADEFGVLSREFDAMMDKLAASRAQVVDAARAAGKSEIATGILHNVGNVLNSVNVSVSLISERVRVSKADKLQRVAQLLEENRGDLSQFLTGDPRGKHVAPYLVELSKLMVLDQAEIQREVDSLNGGIDHIRELVHSQQSYAGRAGPKEPTRIEQLVEAALRISRQAGGMGESVEIVRQVEAMPACLLDRSKVTEILVNLIKNAIESTKMAGVKDPRVTVAAARDPSGRVLISVTDNGVGIAPENLARIFTHGFTTKPKGHGFGLHASANSATEMGATLIVRSEGLGRGATFELDLPLEQEVGA
jgi:signal transduction histidine kinase